MVNDIEALNWGNFDIHDASHIAIMHFRPVLYAVRSVNSPLYCRVEERLNFIKTGEKILFSDGKTCEEKLVALPESADLIFRVRDDNLKVVAENLLGRISKKLDEGYRPLPMDENEKKIVMHQAAIRLRHLMPENKELYFLSEIVQGSKDKARYRTVDDSLIDELYSEDLGSKMVTIHS